MKNRFKPISNIIGIILAFAILIVLIASQPVVHVYAENSTDDTTSPTTTATATSPPRGDSYTFKEWTNSNVEVTLDCTDANSGCNITVYCIDQANTCEPIDVYEGPLIISEYQGESFVRFYSTDNAGNGEVVINEEQVNIDKTNPTITITTPTNGQTIVGTTYIIEGTSDDALSGVDEIELEINDGVNSVFGSENWQYEWKDFADGDYTLTARVTDNAGNAHEVGVAVEVQNPPSGEIVSLTSPPLIKAGRIAIELKISEPVQFYPTLSYSLSSEESIQIPLEGSSRTWKGFVIISEGDHNKIGAFSFQATDFDGNTGTILKKGSYFVVDAVKPDKVEIIEIEVYDDNVEFRWFYDGEEVKQFNIYRSDEGEVNYIDYYKNAPEGSTYTTDDLDGDSYYYKVAAVDLAGNIGPLSDQVHASPEEGEKSTGTSTGTSTSTTNTNIPVLSNQLLKKVNDAIEGVNSQISLIDGFKLNIEKNPYSKKIGLILDINIARNKLIEYRKELENLRKGPASKVNDVIQKVGIKTFTIMNDVPKEISLESEISFIQETSLKDVEVVANLLTYENQKERENYILQNQRLQNRIEIKVEAKHFKVLLYEGKKDITLIKKIISSSIAGDSNVSVVEIIPKIMAETVSKVKFITENYQVLEEDPIVSWKGVKEIEYYVNKKVSGSGLGQARTLLLTENQRSFSIFTGLVVFGNSIMAGGSDFGITIGIIIFSLLIVVYFVYVRKTEAFPIESFLNKRKKVGNRSNELRDLHNASFSSFTPPTRSNRTQPIELKGAVRAGNARDGAYRYQDSRAIINKLNEFARPLNNTQERQLHSIAVDANGFDMHFQDIVQRANDYADQGKFSLASKSYSLLTELYKQLNTENKRQTHSQILKVYNKLNLYTKIKELNTAEKINSGMNLRNLLEHIAELYGEVSKSERQDSELLRFAREYYDHFVSRLGR